MRFVIKRARRGVLRRNQWTFLIVSTANGNVVATGETYNNRTDCIATVRSIVAGIAQSRNGGVLLDIEGEPTATFWPRGDG